ncbi:universal stress protein [uncultured Desulfobulbus sp.]|uniref:universal stress protein n=1 Tax=uncultured Desulfobulbus sp. TaxID=239745 RepID=UPI0029C62CD4|nr:universal stress protein [uncultured Desulfobulbus sp.]
MEKTILVAVDGSVYSSNSLDYLAKFFGPDRSLAIHLLSVVSSGGGGKDWMFDVDPHRSQSPESEKRAHSARKQLKDAEERLVRNGFARERIESRVKFASGISAAIREEAERGNYDSVLIGRRGLGAMGSMFFGSTSGELIEKCHKVPLWIIDGNVNASRFLLAVQSHPSSLMAADHLAFMLKDHPGAEIYLYHSNAVFGSQQPAKAEDFHGQWGQSWCDQYLDLENFLFYAHAQLLADSGIPRHRITQLPAQMHIDVGTDLLRQAKQHHCGTIVIGRRRRDLAKGQLKGVSDKTLNQAQNIAVWLAG